MSLGRWPVCHAGTTAFVPLCLLLLLGAFATHGKADILNVPLCGEVHGFAGEFNDHLHIPIGEEVGNQEAIVLVVRAFSLQLGFLTQAWVQLHVTYKVSAGAEVTILSDDNGIVVLSDVAQGSELEVRVDKRRVDGPVPFRFFSMHANAPTCFVAVAPSNAFYAPVPRTIRVTDNSNNPISRNATYFFKATVPETANAVAVDIREEPGGVQRFHALANDGKAWLEHASGDLITTAQGGTLLFSYSPDERAAGEYALVRISARPSEFHGGVATQTPPAGSPTPSPEGEGSGLPSHEPVAPSSTSQPAPSKKSGSFAFSFLKTVFTLTLVVLAAYMIGCTYYNVRVKGIHDFPDMIPFINHFRACGRMVQLCFARATGRPMSRHTGEYDSLDEHDFYR